MVVEVEVTLRWVGEMPADSADEELIAKAVRDGGIVNFEIGKDEERATT